MPRRKGRKNPLPQRVSLAEPNEGEESKPSVTNTYPDPGLKLPEDPEEMLKALREAPVTSLYRENETRLDEFYQHWANIGKSIPAGGKVHCPKCGREYMTVAGLRYHMTMSCPKMKKYRYTCLICGNEFQIPDEMKEHIQDSHLQFNKQSKRRCRSDMRHLKWLFEEDSETTGDAETSIEDTAFVAGENEDDLEEEEYESDDSEEISRIDNFKQKGSSGSKNDYTWRGHSTYAKLDRPLSEVMPLLRDQFSELEIKFEAVYPNLLPNKKDFESRISVDEWWFNIPHEDLSPPFQINRENLKKKVFTECPGLNAFTSLPADNSHTRQDLTFFAAGPVWAMAWCPFSQGSSKSRQYLALSTHTDLHALNSCFSEPGLIQLWDCGKLGIHRHQNEAPKLILGLSHNNGPIWDLKWCPVGGNINQDKDSHSFPRLGILAAACASSMVLILPIPEGASKNDSNKQQENYNIYRAKPSMILRPSASFTKKDGSKQDADTVFGQCLCVDWSIIDGGKWIVGGYSSGLIALWRLFEPSQLLFTQESEFEPKILTACRSFRAHNKAVRGITWCPFDENVFASGGMDRYLRMWDKNYPEAPLNESNWKGSIITELCWPKLWCGLYAATDEVFVVPYYHGVNYIDALDSGLPPTPAIPFKSTCWSVSSGDWMNCLVGCDATGLVVVYACSNWNRHQHSKKFTPRIKLYSTDVRWNDDIKTKEVSKQKVIPSEDNSSEFTLVFHDTNMTDLKKCEKKKCCTDVRSYEGYPPTISNKPLVQSVTKVRWNPNFRSHTWIASANQSGLVRLHCVDAMHSIEMDKFARDDS